MARTYSQGTIIGQRFGRLRVESETSKRDKQGNIFWRCRCDCGNVCVTTRSRLRRGVTKSCGCLRKELDRLLPSHAVTHGKSKTGAWKSWNTMRRRCDDRNFKDYEGYGKRGIAVCDRWHSFKNFYADMGDRPPGMTLDRRNVDGGYNKENCQWADHTTQMNNTRRNRYLTYDGVTLTMSQWAKRAGISYTVLRARLNTLGWPLGKALGYEDPGSTNYDTVRGQNMERGNKNTRIRLIRPVTMKPRAKGSKSLSAVEPCIRNVRAEIKFKGLIPHRRRLFAPRDNSNQVTEFVKQWVAEHIKSEPGSMLPEILKTWSMMLIVQAEQRGITINDLESAVGCTVTRFIKQAIQNAQPQKRDKRYAEEKADRAQVNLPRRRVVRVSRKII